MTLKRLRWKLAAAWHMLTQPSAIFAYRYTVKGGTRLVYGYAGTWKIAEAIEVGESIHATMVQDAYTEEADSAVSELVGTPKT